MPWLLLQKSKKLTFIDVPKGSIQPLGIFFQNSVYCTPAQTSFTNNINNSHAIFSKNADRVFFCIRAGRSTTFAPSGFCTCQSFFCSLHYQISFQLTDSTHDRKEKLVVRIVRSGVQPSVF